MADSRLALRALRLSIGDREILAGVDLDVVGGKVTALVGPSGAGKTLTARSLIGLLDVDPGVTAGSLEIEVDGEMWRPWSEAMGRGSAARERAFAPIRGRIVGWLPQDARAALDPLRRVRWQVERAGPPGQSVDATALLRRSGLEDADRVGGLWPHELSGGMARRVTIAQALACDSRFLLVDEPTAGLDAVAVVALCRELRRLADGGIGVLLITHDLRALRGLADQTLFMDGGRIVEAIDGSEPSEARSDVARRLVVATRRISEVRT